MTTWFQSRLVGRLLLSFVPLSLVPIVIVGYLAFDSGREALQKAQFEKLLTERDLRKKEVLKYFHETIQNVRFLADTSSVSSAAETLLSYHEYGRATQDAPFDIKSDLYEKMYGKIHPFFESFLKTHYVALSGYSDLLLIGADEGNIMYTSLRLADLGSNLRTGALKDSGLAKLWQRVAKSGAAGVADFEMYQPIKGPAGFVGVPVRDEKGKVNAVLVLRLGPENINGVFRSTQAAGQTTDAYLVGEDSLMRSDSRFEKGSTILTKRVDSTSVKKAFSEKAGMELAQSYRGMPVLSAFSLMDLKTDPQLGADFEWAVVSDVGIEEAFQPVTALRTRVVIAALLIGIVVLVVTYVTARGIAKPAVALADQVTKVSGGDLTVDLPDSGRSDEIGSLIRATGAMVGSLREQAARVTEGVTVLREASSEISTTVEHLMESTSRTSAAVTETTTTVEEVKQAASVSMDQAKSVSQRAQDAVQISHSGEKATDDTIQKMHVIKDQMASIGESVIKLAEQSRQIEGIIATVQDLADQSNLLAVNASIEAARAGEHGKGFAVVASEIKSLADQSKAATAQVEFILGETRKWINSAVMATEQGARAVDTGVEQSLTAAKSIESLAKDVENSANSATVIAASSEQQFAGIEQVAGAVVNIEQAIRENLEHATRLKDLAGKLGILGDSLKELAAKHRV